MSKNTKFLNCNHNGVNTYTQICSQCNTNIWASKAEILSNGDPLKQKLYENQEEIESQIKRRDEPWDSNGW